MTHEHRIKTITVEEHFATAEFLDGPGQGLKNQARAASQRPQGEIRIDNQLIDRLCDLDQLRIEEMDRAGIDVQVLSLTSPGVEALEDQEAITWARYTNDHLAEALQRHPDRLNGFASLPVSIPEKAAQELERTIHQHGFVGAVINGHIRGRYLDDPFFWPILEAAQALQAPIYLHPTTPPQPVIQASYVGNFAPEVTARLAAAAWGWHIETAIHILRIILSGAFDRYPNLQFIIGHMGEALPFMLPRLERTLPPQVTQLERPIGDYLRQNLSYSFSGFNYIPNFLDLLLQVGVERILFSADYPYSSMETAMSFLEQLPVSPADKERIAHTNAEQLFRLGLREKM